MLVVGALTTTACSNAVTQEEPRSHTAPVTAPDQMRLAQTNPSRTNPSQPTVQTSPTSTNTSASPTNSAPTPTSKPRVTYNSVDIDQPYVALTFDDGPHKTLTPKLLDILKARNIKATFYVVGRNVNAYPEIAKRIVDEGHEIANHTWSHPYLTKLSDSGIRSEVEKTDVAILKATGVKPTNLRPPYGAMNSRVREVVYGMGYPLVMWSVDPKDWQRPGPSVVTRRLVDGASNGGILLLHDIHAPTIQAVPSALDQLIARGYRFATVQQLIDMEMRQEAQPAPEPTVESATGLPDPADHPASGAQTRTSTSSRTASTL